MIETGFYDNPQAFGICSTSCCWTDWHAMGRLTGHEQLWIITIANRITITLAATSILVFITTSMRLKSDQLE